MVGNLSTLMNVMKQRSMGIQRCVKGSNLKIITTQEFNSRYICLTKMALHDFCIIHTSRTGNDRRTLQMINERMAMCKFY